MEHEKIARHIAKLITNGSMYYHAHISKEPRLFLKLADKRKVKSLKHGIIIKKYYDTYWMKSRAFIFLPDIADYVRHKSRVDLTFAERARTLTFVPDDIERMVHTMTHGNIRLRLKGRKVFKYLNGSSMR